MTARSFCDVTLRRFGVLSTTRLDQKLFPSRKIVPFTSMTVLSSGTVSQQHSVDSLRHFRL